MNHLLLSPCRKSELAYVELPDLDPADQKREPNEQEPPVVAEAKPIPSPASLIPLLYREGIRVHVCLPNLKIYSRISAVAAPTLRVMEVSNMDIPISHVAPATLLEERQEVFIYPAEGVNYFGTMVKTKGLEKFIISFNGKKEVAIPRTRIWPLSLINREKHKKELLEALKKIEE